MKNLFILTISLFFFIGCDSMDYKEGIIILSGITNLQDEKETSGYACILVELESADISTNIEDEPVWTEWKSENLCGTVEFLTDGTFTSKIPFSFNIKQNRDFRIKKADRISLQTNKYHDEYTTNDKFRVNHYFGQLTEPWQFNSENDVFTVHGNIKISLDTFDIVSQYSFEEISRQCSKFKNSKSKNPCLDNRIPPHIAKACKDFAPSSYNDQLVCLNSYLDSQ